MTSPKKLNKTDQDSAEIYWDWEKTKIVNCPIGPPRFQQFPFGGEYLTRPELPRAGTLKRSKAFAGSEDTQSAKDGGLKNDKAGIKKHENEGKVEPEFPETLYSEAKRRVVEDMGSRFMRTIQKLDRADLKDPVDFNSILERHWAELAEFYSAQVSTVRKLERKLKTATLGSSESLQPTSPLQLPPYLMAQLSELKLRPFVFTNSEKKPGPACRPELEESKRPIEECYNSELPESEMAGAKTCITPDEFHHRYITQVQDPIRWNYEASRCGETIEATTIGLSVTDGLTTGEYRESVHECISDRQPAQEVIREVVLYRIHEDPRPDFRFPSGVESGNKRRPEPDLYRDNSAQDIEPEVSQSMATSQTNDEVVPNYRGVDEKENIQTADIEEAEDQHLREFEDATIATTAYPMISHLIENYKALAEVMRLAAIHDGPHSENSPSARIDKNKTNRTKREDDSGSSSPQIIVQPKTPTSQSADTPDAIIRGGESATDNQIQKNDFIERTPDTLDSEMYTLSPANTSSITTNSLGRSGETFENGDYPGTESLVDMPYDTLVCTPEQITLDGSRATLPLLGHSMQQCQGQIQTVVGATSEYYLDIAVAESLPHYNSNNSFSISDDSSLFSGSTRGNLEKLQMEVKDHLEQAERQGALLVARWVGEFAMKKEISEIDEEGGANNPSENHNGGGEGENEECEEGQSGSDGRIEVFEFEYVDDCEDSGDEDGEIDQEMDKILAWIALEDEKAMQSTASQVIVKFDKTQVEEALDTDNSDDEGVREKSTATVTTRILVGGGPGVVNKKGSEEDLVDEESKDEQRGKTKAEEGARRGSDDGDRAEQLIFGVGKVKVDNNEAEVERVIMGTKNEVMGKSRDTKVEEVVVGVTEENSDNSVYAESEEPSE